MKNTYYQMTPSQLAKKITNRVIEYHNEGESSIKKDGIRKFLVEEVQADAFSSVENRRYLKVKTRDLDDGGKSKYRTIHVAGIAKVDGKIKTAARMVKTVF